MRERILRGGARPPSVAPWPPLPPWPKLSNAVRGAAAPSAVDREDAKTLVLRERSRRRGLVLSGLDQVVTMAWSENRFWADFRPPFLLAVVYRLL